MKNDQRPKYHLYVRAFENAKWILTDKKSGEVTEYNYSEMSRIVINAYSKKEVKPQNPTIRYLHQVSCVIYREGYVEDVSYSQILPDYTIKCYNWHYQCPRCDAVQPEIRGKKPKKAIGIYCLSCREYSELNPSTGALLGSNRQ